MGVSVSEGLHYNRIQQGHVLSSSDRQPVCSVVVDDLRYRGEGGAVLPKNVTSIFTLSELHMHEALTAPGRKKGETAFGLNQHLHNGTESQSAGILKPDQINRKPSQIAADRLQHCELANMKQAMLLCLKLY